ncbi:hypothetical protein D9M70_550710 [compost metagenome]
MLAAQQRQQCVPAGVEVHGIDALAGAAVRVQLGRMAVGVGGPLLHFRLAQPRAELPQRFGMPAAAKPLQRGADERIAAEEVVVRKVRHLVEDAVRGGVGHDGMSPGSAPCLPFTLHGRARGTRLSAWSSASCLFLRCTMRDSIPWRTGVAPQTTAIWHWRPPVLCA